MHERAKTVKDAADRMTGSILFDQVIILPPPSLQYVWSEFKVLLMPYKIVNVIPGWYTALSTVFLLKHNTTRMRSSWLSSHRGLQYFFLCWSRPLENLLHNTQFDLLRSLNLRQYFCLFSRPLLLLLSSDVWFWIFFPYNIPPPCFSIYDLQ